MQHLVAAALHLPLRNEAGGLMARKANMQDRLTCRSVCSWLLMRTKRCPVAAARCATRLVFPLLVGPCARADKRF